MKKSKKIWIPFLDIMLQSQLKLSQLPQHGVLIKHKLTLNHLMQVKEGFKSLLLFFTSMRCQEKTVKEKTLKQLHTTQRILNPKNR